jgi:hypothetical protein
VLIGESSVGKSCCDLFISFVDEHLRKEGVKIKEGLKMVCPNGHRFDDDAIKACVAEGKTDIGCSIVRSPAFRPQASDVDPFLDAKRFRLKAGLRTA